MHWFGYWSNSTAGFESLATATLNRMYAKLLDTSIFVLFCLYFGFWSPTHIHIQCTLIHRWSDSRTYNLLQILPMNVYRSLFTHVYTFPLIYITIRFWNQYNFLVKRKKWFTLTILLRLNFALTFDFMSDHVRTKQTSVRSTLGTSLLRDFFRFPVLRTHLWRSLHVFVSLTHSTRCVCV